MMHFDHITTHCLNADNEAAVGVLCNQLEGYETQLATGKDALAKPVMDICSRTDDLPAIQTLADNIRARFDHVIICGSGGSGLSSQVLCNLKLARSTPHIYALDNIDPSEIEALFNDCPAERTCVIGISKSGSTAETISQFFAFYHHFEKTLGRKSAEHFITITTPGDNPMRRFTEQRGGHVIDHPMNIGGRFSLFTAVGLLAAAIKGLDIAALRRGAAENFALLGKAIHPARLGAALQYDHMRQGKTITVMLPYCERLAGFSSWYRQSWAESLGKSGKGTTPIRAIGTTDQHSQLQLYLDGPNDKFFNLILLNRMGTGQLIAAPDYSELAYLKGKTTGDVMGVEQQATLETLLQHGRPVRLINIPELNETTLGALLAHFMLEIFFMAQLLGVNAFDQPAVEEGKVIARNYLLG